MHTSFFKQYLETFKERQVQFHSAALAFYIVVALPAFVVFFLSIAGLFISAEGLRAWLDVNAIVGFSQFEQVRAGVIQFSSLTAVLSALLMIWSGSAIFHRIQQGLRAMWYIKLDIGSGLHRFFAGKLLAIIIALVFVIGIVGLFLVTQIVTVLLATIGDALPILLPSVIPIAQLIQFVLVVCVITLAYALFGDARVSWQLTLSGAIVVSLVYTLMQYGFQSYVSNLAAVHWYGAAGYIIVFLLLMYIMGMVFYGTAIWMYVVSERDSSYVIVPRSYAHQTSDPNQSMLQSIVQFFKRNV